MILEILGRRVPTHFLRREVGIRSFDLLDMIILQTSSSVTDSKSERSSPDCVLSFDEMEGSFPVDRAPEGSSQILVILLLKYSHMQSASSLEESYE